MISLQPINESNFLQAFALEVSEDQQRFVSDPIRSLPRLMYTGISASLLAYTTMTPWSAMSWSFMITISPNMIYGICRWTETARTEAMESRH